MTEDGIIKFQEKKGPIGAQKKYVYSESAKAFVPLASTSDGQDETSTLDNVKCWLRSAFLPQGYPNSVSDDYFYYQVWDTLQAYASSIAGALSLQAAMTGLGVGESSATPLAAAITWLLKDGCGMISSISFAYCKGGQLDCNSKQWRLFADVSCDLSNFLKLIAPVLPIPFLAVMCFSAVTLSLVGVAGGSTKAAFAYHQARADNMAELSAKESIQETVVNLAALLTNITILPMIASNTFLIWITFILCVLMHILTNYMAIRAVKMESLNRPRLLHVLSSWFSKAAIPDIAETNIQEPLLWGPAFIADYFPHSFRLSLGCSLQTALKKFDQSFDLKNIYTSTSEVFGQDNFMVVGNFIKRHLFIAYRRGITPHQELEAFYTAYLSVLNYVHLKEGLMLSSEHLAPGLTASSSASEIIPAVRLHVRKSFPDFIKNMDAKGWHTHKLLFAAGDWRIE